MGQNKKYKQHLTQIATLPQNIKNIKKLIKNVDKEKFF